MKVALVNDYEKNTGIGNYAFNLFEQIKKEKEIDVKMVFLGEDKEIRESKELHFIKPSNKFPFFKKTLNNIYFFPKKVPKGFDLYHLSNQFLSKIAKFNKPSVISCMDVIPKVFGKEFKPMVAKLLVKAMQEMDEAEKIITISNFSKKELAKNFHITEHKIKTIYLGFDKKIFKPRKKEECRKKLGFGKEKIVLNVGSEEPRKNIPVLLKAFQELKSKHENAKLIRIGEQRSETRKEIAKLGLKKNILYFNKIDLKTLGLFYNAADVLAFCSYYEGFGLPVLEAMASGTAVVCTKEASIPEVAGKAALYFKKNDYFELKEKILKVFEEEKLQKKLVEMGLKQAKKFSWEKCAEETVKLYKKVL